MANKVYGKFTEVLAKDEIGTQSKKTKKGGKLRKRQRKRANNTQQCTNADYVTDNVAPRKGQKMPSSTATAGEADWENEVAKKILTIYRSDVEHKSIENNNVLPAVSKVSQKKGGKQVNGSIHNYIPRHIWFAGTGAVRAMWCAVIPATEEQDSLVLSVPTMFECHHQLCVKLRALEKTKHYTQYVTLVETLLRKRTHGGEISSEFIEDDELRMWGLIDPSIFSRRDHRQTSDKHLWQQLIVCMNVFGTKLAECGKFGASLQMLKRNEVLLTNDPLLEGSGYFHGPIRHQLLGFLYDSMSFYYFKRKKFNAAAVYSQKALKKHLHVKSWEHVAKCYLHGGAILSMMNKHEDSVRCMKQVMQMLEEGKLEQGGSNAQKICLIAVGYHNIAVEQLILHRLSDACVSSQNARRLARMSLSYSNRWLSQFEATHQEALRKMMSKPNAPKNLFGEFASSVQSPEISIKMANTYYS